MELEAEERETIEAARLDDQVFSAVFSVRQRVCLALSGHAR